MRIKDGFALKTIAGTNVVVPLGDNTVTFRAVVTLNDSGAFLWRKLIEDTTEEALLKAMMTEYAVDEETARADISEFLENLKKANMLV